MNTDLPIDPNISRLVAAHPLLFRGETPACFSDLSPGWYEIVDRLCTNIEKELGPEGCAELDIRQIKEKYGTLRFYYQLGDSHDLHLDAIGEDGSHEHFVKAKPADPTVERVRALVRAACEASELTCAQCGRPGKLLVHERYYMTRCPEHTP